MRIRTDGPGVGGDSWSDSEFTWCACLTAPRLCLLPLMMLASYYKRFTLDVVHASCLGLRGGAVVGALVITGPPSHQKQRLVLPLSPVHCADRALRLWQGRNQIG